MNPKYAWCKLIILFIIYIFILYFCINEVCVTWFSTHCHFNYLLLFKSIKVCVYVIFRFDAYIVIVFIHTKYIIYETTLGVQYPQGLVLFGAPCAPKSKPFTQPTWQVQCLYRPTKHLVIATLPSCKTMMTSVVKEVCLKRESILYWIYEYSEPIGFMLIWIWNLYLLCFRKPMNCVTIYFLFVHNFCRKINRK